MRYVLWLLLSVGGVNLAADVTDDFATALADLPNNEAKAVPAPGAKDADKKQEHPDVKTPEGKQSAPAKAPSEQKIEGVGLDTIDLNESSGNWLHKRIWWERAQQRLERLREKVSQVLEARMQFFTKKTEAEQTIFDPLYLEVGVGQGELTVILSHLVNEIERLRKLEGKLTKQESDFLEMVSAQQKVLEQLNLDIQAMNKLDNALEDALAKLMDQGTKARGYEKQAWEYVHTIARELSDKRARELYYHVETLDKTVGDILNYIKNEFSKSFEQLLKTAKEQASRIKEAVKHLKEKGVDFKKQAEGMEKQALEREKLRMAHEKDEAITKAVAATQEELSWTALPGRIWATICSWGASVWDGVSSFARAISTTVKGWFGGSKEPSEELVVPVVASTESLAKKEDASQVALDESLQNESHEKAADVASEPSEPSDVTVHSEPQIEPESTELNLDEQEPKTV